MAITQSILQCEKCGTTFNTVPDAKNHITLYHGIDGRDAVLSHIPYPKDD